LYFQYSDVKEQDSLVRSSRRVVLSSSRANPRNSPDYWLTGGFVEVGVQQTRTFENLRNKTRFMFNLQITSHEYRTESETTY